MNATVASSIHIMWVNFFLSTPLESLARTLDIKASNKITIMIIGAAEGATKVGSTSNPCLMTRVPGSGAISVSNIPRSSNEIRRKPKFLKRVIISGDCVENVIVAELLIELDKINVH